MADSGGDLFKRIMLRGLGVGALVHAFYALMEGAVRFPGGRGGTGGGWVYWSEDPGVFLVMFIMFVGLGVTGLIIKPVGEDGLPPD
ncbi:hypothetical protein [Halospina denitrificans]|uniref:hypothetical protein n=1 Tax=Halospina denitrificans TaxID=332522 RepID=UPI00105D87BE|nr:hypothetical protein [Halospina denitrificans]